MPANTKEITIMPSTLETVDYAVYNWLNDSLDLHTSTQSGFEKVPVIWAGAERAYQVKRDKDARDQDGTLILPLITIERTSVTKDLSRKGSVWAALPEKNDEYGGTITVARRIKQDKTANFLNADSWRKNSDTGPNQRTFPKRDSLGRLVQSEKIVYETITVPIPVYLEINYMIAIKTEYQEQMNDLVVPFMTRTGGINYFSAKHDGHSYESFIDSSFVQENNVSSLQTEQRRYETRINIRTLGYVIGQGKNQERPKIVVRENAVEVKLPREKVIMGDIPEHIDKRGFYKE